MKKYFFWVPLGLLVLIIVAGLITWNYYSPKFVEILKQQETSYLAQIRVLENTKEEQEKRLNQIQQEYQTNLEQLMKEYREKLASLEKKKKIIQKNYQNSSLMELQKKINQEFDLE